MFNFRTVSALTQAVSKELLSAHAHSSMHMYLIYHKLRQSCATAWIKGCISHYVKILFYTFFTWKSSVVSLLGEVGVVSSGSFWNILKRTECWKKWEVSWTISVTGYCIRFSCIFNICYDLISSVFLGKKTI